MTTAGAPVPSSPASRRPAGGLLIAAWVTTAVALKAGGQRVVCSVTAEGVPPSCTVNGAGASIVTASPLERSVTQNGTTVSRIANVTAPTDGAYDITCTGGGATPYFGSDPGLLGRVGWGSAADSAAASTGSTRW